MALLVEETDLEKSKLGTVETTETNVEDTLPEVVVNVSKEALQEPEKAQPKEVRSQLNTLRSEVRKEQIDNGSKPPLKPTLTSEQTTLATNMGTLQRSTPGTRTKSDSSTEAEGESPVLSTSKESSLMPTSMKKLTASPFVPVTPFATTMTPLDAKEKLEDSTMNEATDGKLHETLPKTTTVALVKTLIKAKMSKDIAPPSERTKEQNNATISGKATDVVAELEEKHKTMTEQTEETRLLSGEETGAENMGKIRLGEAGPADISMVRDMAEESEQRLDRHKIKAMKKNMMAREQTMNLTKAGVLPKVVNPPEGEVKVTELQNQQIFENF